MQTPPNCAQHLLAIDKIWGHKDPKPWLLSVPRLSTVELPQEFPCSPPLSECLPPAPLDSLWLRGASPASKPVKASLSKACVCYCHLVVISFSMQSSQIPLPTLPICLLIWGLQLQLVHCFTHNENLITSS